VLGLLNPTSLVASSGYAAIFLLCIAQSCCVPTSSELTMGFAGVLAAEGHLGLPQVILVGAVGELLGAYLAWFIGRLAGRAVVDRYGKYLLLSHRDLDRAEAWYDRHPRFGVLGSRLLPVIRNFVALPAGIAEVPLVRFGVLTFIGSLIWDAGMALIGYSVGQRWREVMKGFNDAGYVLAVLVVAAIALFIWHRWRSYRAATAEVGSGRMAASGPSGGTIPTGGAQEPDGALLASSWGAGPRRTRGQHLAGRRATPGASRAARGPRSPAPGGRQLPDGALRVRRPEPAAPITPPAGTPRGTDLDLAGPPLGHPGAPFDWAQSAGEEPTRVQPALAAEAQGFEPHRPKASAQPAKGPSSARSNPLAAGPADQDPANLDPADPGRAVRRPSEEPTTVHSALGRLQPARPSGQLPDPGADRPGREPGGRAAPSTPAPSTPAGTPAPSTPGVTPQRRPVPQVGTAHVRILDSQGRSLQPRPAPPSGQRPARD